VNVRDGIYQQTPLHRVCFKGQQEKDIYSEELLLWLVTEGRADLFAVDRFGHKVHQSSLHSALLCLTTCS
jgi:hypothetical protein